MDLNTVIARAKAIVISPADEWPKIAERPETVQSLYKDYLLVILAIPAVFGFLQASIIGIHVPVLGTYRVGLVSGLVDMALRYVVNLGAIYILALIVDALASSFGGTKNRLNAFKTVAYASTAGAVAGAGAIVPGIGMLIMLAGAAYTLYLLYLGLPVLMRAPKEKATAYTGVAAAAAIVIFLVLGWILGGVWSPGPRGSASSEGGFEKGSAMGQLEDKAKKLEAAQKSGDAEAQKQAMGEMMGSLFAGGDVVEALAPEKIRGFLPETLGALPRSNATAERNEAMGMQMSLARADYADGAEKSLNLEITDMGGAKGIAAGASWAQVAQERQTDTGYEKTYKAGDRMIHEMWDNQSKDGEYSLILADRFSVKVSGRADGIATLKAAAESVDLSGLEALKNEGVKQGG